MYILLKTDDEKILAKQVKGAEAAVVQKNTGTISTLDQVSGLLGSARDSQPSPPRQTWMGVCFTS